MRKLLQMIAITFGLLIDTKTMIRFSELEMVVKL
ncbi:hypothetical protein DES34_1324 [Brevibacillus brevis]|nr:hypothetical protein DES34_1324 [Brevibacillus brevis]TQK41801.1 hypothetical protein FB479_1195 [Brevibacillus sp. AG162]VEF86319.1 Uncharacterised protein [Brevibacillus brevis]